MSQCDKKTFVIGSKTDLILIEKIVSCKNVWYAPFGTHAKFSES